MRKSTESSAKLSMNIVFIAALLFVLVIGIVSYSSHRMIAMEAHRSAENLLEGTKATIEGNMHRVGELASNAAWVAADNVKNEEYLYHLTAAIVAENPDIVGSAVAFASGAFDGRHFFSPYSYRDSAGVVHTKQLGNDDYDYFSMEWFAIPYKLGTPNWSEPYYDEGGGEMLMSTYSYPIKDESGNVFAVLTADLSLDWIHEEVNSIRPYEHSYVMVVSPKGTYLGNGRPECRDTNIFQTTASNTDRGFYDVAFNMTSGMKGSQLLRLDGKPAFAVYAPLFNGWSVAIISEYRDVLSENASLQLWLIIFGLVILCAFFGYMKRHISLYVKDLKATTASNERYASELNIASAIQTAMLPRNFPDSSCGVSLHAMLKPAKEVGGDMYDFSVKDGILYFMVGDVSGKGVPASLVMSITKQAFVLLDGLEMNAAQLVKRVSDSLSQNNDSLMFVTLFLGKLNLQTGELQFCNAGHNPGIIVSPDGEASFMKVEANVALGVWEDFQFKMQTITLEKGTKLVLYTDGISEAERADGSQFGEARLLDTVRTLARDCDTPEQGCEALYSAVKEFAAGNDQNDDITIMTIKY